MKGLIERLRQINRFKKLVIQPGSPFRHLKKWASEVRNHVLHPGIYKSSFASGSVEAKQAKAHAANLKASGFSASTGDFEDRLLNELQQLYFDRLRDEDGGNKKVQHRPFMTRLTADEKLDDAHILVRFALQSKVLATAHEYLGQSPYLSSVQIFQSRSSGQKQWIESQLWHRDYEDARTVKLWVYLTDVVNVECGPFTFLDSSKSAKVKNSFFPTRLNDSQMESQGVLASQQQVIGPKFTSFYVDSSVCYHQGSRVVGNNVRAVYEATFVTHSPLYDIKNEISSSCSLDQLRNIVLNGI